MGGQGERLGMAASRAGTATRLSITVTGGPTMGMVVLKTTPTSMGAKFKVARRRAFMTAKVEVAKVGAIVITNLWAAQPEGAKVTDALTVTLTGTGVKAKVAKEKAIVITVVRTAQQEVTTAMPVLIPTGTVAEIEVARDRVIVITAVQTARQKVATVTIVLKMTPTGTMTEVEVARAQHPQMQNQAVIPTLVAEILMLRLRGKECLERGIGPRGVSAAERKEKVAREVAVRVPVR